MRFEDSQVNFPKVTPWMTIQNSKTNTDSRLARMVGIMDDYGWLWMILDHSEVLKTFEIFAISVQVTPAKRLELQRVNGSAEWIEWTWALVYTTILWHLMTRIFMRILRIYWWLLMRHTSRFSEWHSRQDKATMFKNHNLFLDIWWRLLCFIVCILGVWALTSFFAEKAHFCSSFRLESLEINRKKYVKFKKRTGTLSTTFFFGCNFSVTRSVFVVFFCPDLAHWPHLRSMARTVAVVEVLCGWSSMEQWIWVGRNICTRCSMSRLPSLFQTALSACRCERKLSETKSSTWSVHISSWTLANHWHGDSLSQFGWIWDAPPHPATIMNLIIALFVGDPYQPSSSSVTGEGFRISNRKIGETIMLC